MLLGYLDERGRALVRFQVRGKTGAWATMVCEIDTGAEPSFLTSRSWLEHLDAETERGDMITMADGQEVPAIYAVVEIEWFGQTRLIDVLTPLSETTDSVFRPPSRRGRRPNAVLGRGLLTDCRLTIDYGAPTITIDASTRAAA
jgi:predicted aspartyl protease